MCIQRAEGSGKMPAIDRISKWKQKLLDLNKRNRLLNFRETKRSSLSITTPNCKDLFEWIVNKNKQVEFILKDPSINALNYDNEDNSNTASNVDFTLFGDFDYFLYGIFDKKKKTWVEKYGDSKAVYDAIGKYPTEIFSSTDDESGNRVETDYWYIEIVKNIDKMNFKLKDGQVLTNKPDKELLRTLKQIRQRAHTALEEQGVNVLYLAFGFLEWTEVDYSDVKIKSPIVLVPVSLTIDSMVDPYRLEMLDEDIVINPILQYKLATDFGIYLNELPDSDSWGISDYLEQLRTLGLPKGWEINEDVQLSLFSFLKLNMYKDMELYAPEMADHPIIKAISGDDSDLAPVPDDILNADTFDQDIKPIDAFQVIDADSSQQQAILAAKNGISFILQGPPGTGKSQTITNIIAECLASDKKVLFVSEKLAALEVVYRRLAEVELTDYCLELHSHKAKKKEVIEELGRTLIQPRTRVTNDIFEQFERLFDSRAKLNEYVVELHKERIPLKCSIYQVHGRMMELSSMPDLLFQIDNPSQWSITQLNKCGMAIRRLALAINKMGNEYNSNPWKGCHINSLSFDQRTDIQLHFQRLNSLINDLLEIVHGIEGDLALRTEHNLHSINKLYVILEIAEHSDMPPIEWFYFDDLPAVKEEAEKHALLTEQYKSKKALIDAEYNNDIYYFSESSLAELNQNIELVMQDFQECFVSEIRELIIQRAKILEHFSGLINILKELNRTSKTLTDLIGTNMLSTIKDVEHFLSLQKILMKPICPTKRWFSESSFGEVEVFIDKTQNLFNELTDLKKDVSLLYKNSIMDLDYMEFLKTFEADYNIDSIMMGFGHLSTESLSPIDKALEQREQIEDQLMKAIEFCRRFILLSQSISDAIGIQQPSTLSEAESLIRLCSLVIKNPKPLIDWFNSRNIAKLMEFSRECEEVYNEIRELEREILESFDKEIMQLDYNDVIARFRTEYNSFIKFFKPSYYKDIKSIRIYALDPKIKLSVNDYLGILHKLKLFNEKKQWLTNNESKMLNSFGSWFNG